MLLVKQQTMLANALRGLAAEFGLVAPLGSGKLAELVERVEADAGVPEAARHAMRALHAQLGAVRDAAAGLEEAVVAHARRDETARRLATIPSKRPSAFRPFGDGQGEALASPELRDGVGPVAASLIAATVTDVGAFRSARHFAAWLGLVPRQHSTGGKARLGRITKAGNEQIRMLLVLGATSMARRAEHWNSAAGAWMRELLARRLARLATVALANKMARVAPRHRPSRAKGELRPTMPPCGTDRFAMAVMARKEDYRPSGRAAAAATAGAAA